jgi:hypothetical protein
MSREKLFEVAGSGDLLCGFEGRMDVWGPPTRGSEESAAWGSLGCGFSYELSMPS